MLNVALLHFSYMHLYLENIVFYITEGRHVTSEI